MELDEDSNNPNDVIVVAIEELSDDIEIAYDEYNKWLDSKSEMIENNKEGNPEVVAM